MIVRPRVIPVLLLDNQSLVKTVKFANPYYLGDPINAVKIFSEKGVDELCILDISATKEEKHPDFDLLAEIATEAFMPLSYGGGIRDIDDVKRLIKMGFEKVIFNSALISNAELVKKAVQYLGSQSVIASIDYKKNILGKPICYIQDGSKKTKYTPQQLANLSESYGVGEIILQSIDNDGMMNGYDIECIKNISDQSDIPVVACGGAKDINSIKQVLELGNAHAVAAGSMFVYYGKKKAVLINVPTDDDFINKGVYYERGL